MTLDDSFASQYFMSATAGLFSPLFHLTARYYYYYYFITKASR